jgi:hypothetical protein
MSVNIDSLYVEGVNNLNDLSSHHSVIFKPRKTAYHCIKFHTVSKLFIIYQTEK